MARRDPHSYSDDRHVEVHRFAWTATVAFETRTLHATVRLAFDAKPAAPPVLDLDSRGLSIETVSANDATLRWELGEVDAILGQRLRIHLPPRAAEDGGSIVITYLTSPDASAVQWLAPEQTAGGEHPFVFTQCQAIHARSLVPLQDTPSRRVTYHAELDVPATLRALMAARDDGRGEASAGRRVERWSMPQPIPPYLIAFAVGDLASAELGPRSRVWAEPRTLARAAHEFAGVDDMLRCAESLFGPYDWDRFDLLVMPPSFPYGGMENPRLTFLTPTLLAGDRSLVGVVAHELAHSWTGNLVSGASAEHFWLNEGMTVWAERRIVEALFGVEAAALDAALGRRELDDAIAAFGSRPQLTHLRTSLDGVDPDDVFSVVPYEKGYLFARALEDAAGRPAFDRFVATYVRELRFRSITTDDFVALVRAELPGALERVGASAYLEQAGVPASAPAPRSSRFDEIAALGDTLPSTELADRLGPTEWQLYLGSLPRPCAHAAELAQRFGLFERENHEIRTAFVELALDSGVVEAMPRAEALVAEVGRMKYLRPLYAAMARRDPARARAVFGELRGRYHPVAAQGIARLLEKV